MLLEGCLHDFAARSVGHGSLKWRIAFCPSRRRKRLLVSASAMESQSRIWLACTVLNTACCLEFFSTVALAVYGSSSKHCDWYTQSWKALVQCPRDDFANGAMSPVEDGMIMDGASDVGPGRTAEPTPAASPSSPLPQEPEDPDRPGALQPDASTQLDAR